MAAVFVLLEVLVNTILELLNTTGLNVTQMAESGLILLVGTFVLGVLSRFVFGKKSMLNHAVCSSIAIIFIYCITALITCCGVRADLLTAPLPFMEIRDNTLILLSPKGMDYTILFSQILSMIILTFLVSLAEGWLSKGKKFLAWLALRFLIVLIGYGLHLVATYLFNRFLPEGLVTYAPTVLLGILVLLLATGALKIVIGALLSTVNPIIGGLYTFFFANIIGKKLTASVLTCGILVGLILALEYIGVTVITIGSGILLLCIPFLILLVLLWYLINKLL